MAFMFRSDARSGMQSFAGAGGTKRHETVFAAGRNLDETDGL